MKIVIVGGGTAGHFYPLMAVTEEVKKQAVLDKVVDPQIYYFGEKNYNPKMLEERGVMYVYIPSGKNRLYFSFLNFLDIFKVFGGTIYAFFKLLVIFPDVIFSKGGYDSVPTCLAAFMLRIPIVMHDSDSVPGRASLLVSRFAYRIAVSYPEAVKYFKNNAVVAVVGQPMLQKYTPAEDYIRNYKKGRKNILIVGGSSGSVKINDKILEVLPELCSVYNVIHQTGENNILDIKARSSVVLASYNKDAYAAYASLDFSKIYPDIDLVISRAGSVMFEFAAWQIPAIIIPISSEVSRDQESNAYAMEKLGAIKVVLEENLTSHLLLNLIASILDDNAKYESMTAAAKSNTKFGASNAIAKEIVKIIASHK